ncbi:NAD(P)H-hydrate dehydratase [Caldisericum exile]|uniref:NAD(P)H-hydrate dehydratase n=1 Tax=Caldisericum exile TaxID=693075 RepID=UPI003C785E11
MKVVTSEEIKKLDELAINSGISEEILMENAGSAVFYFLKSKFGLLRKFLIFAGSGNNGGDAFTVARLLSSHNAEVTLFTVSDTTKLKGTALKNFELLKNYPVEVLEFTSINRVLLLAIKEADVIIDGIFGTGLNRPINGKIEELVVEINNSGKPVVAIDIPSGVSANTGEVLGVAIKANYTITMGLPKRGFFAYPGCDYVGKIIVNHITYPPEITHSKDISVEIKIIEPYTARPTDAHKGSLGKALFIAGSSHYTGAPYFNALSFLKGGGGISYLATTEYVSKIVSERSPEIVQIPLKENKNGAISSEDIGKIIEFSKNVDVVAIGSGLSIDEDTEQLVLNVIQNVQKPLIIDGDAITIISKYKEILKKRTFDTVLTPHIGEFSRLTGLPVNEIKKDKFSALFKAMKEIQHLIVLKGEYSLIGLNGNIYINTSGNPLLATAGSGDVLVGTIASSIARKGNTLEGTILGTYIHGLSGDLLANEFKEGITALDILQNIPNAIRYYWEHYKELEGAFYERL